MLFFLASASCSVFGILTIDLSPLQGALESVDLAVSTIGIVLGIYGLFLSMRTDFKPVEQYRTISLYFGAIYCLLFAMKVVIEGFEKTDVLSLFECGKTVTAASIYSLLLVILIFSVAKFVTQVRKFETDLVQLNAHTIPLLNSKSVLAGP